MTALLVSLLVALAALSWPRRPSPRLPVGSIPQHGLGGVGAEGPEPPGSSLQGHGRALTVASVQARAPRRWAVWRRRAYQEAHIDAVLGVVEALVPALQAGLPPVSALRAVGRLTHEADTVTTALIEAADAGLPLGTVWFRNADRLDSSDLRLVGSAWSLCDAVGSPLAATLATVVGTVRQRRELKRRIDAALAGPQATVRVLSLLPALGPVVAVVVGVPLDELYAGSAGLAALASGAGLMLVGRWWCHRLVRAVTVDAG